MSKSSQKKPKPKTKKKKKLSAEEKARAKLKADHRKGVRSVFNLCGFKRVGFLSDKEFIFEGQKSDFDDLFIYENVFVFAEYTTTQSSAVGEHLKLKKILYDKVFANPTGFITFLKSSFPAITKILDTQYHPSSLLIRVLYCSRFDFDEHYKENVPGPIYMDYPILRYFTSVVEAIRKSTRHELFHFLEIDAAKIGDDGKINVATQSRDYHGSVLPESHSHFDSGYKVITFYADPEALLKTCYVLRKEGWRESINLYQRMISKKKIEAIRHYLKDQKRVFINNIVVTLPSDVKPLDKKGNTVETSNLTTTSPVIIKIPFAQNSVGIVDGQHRIFAYHETIVDDPEIAKLRIQQNLLITGIIFPQNISSEEREQFEARLFLEINSNQTNAKSDLKQAIGVVLDPLSPESIASRVLSALARKGPLTGFIQQHFYETDKLKTSSIVSYGLKPLVKLSGDDSLFSTWSHTGKNKLKSGKGIDALKAYIEYCSDSINTVLSAIKQNVSADRWTTDKKVAKRLLTTTQVNGFLILTRLLVESKINLDQSAIAKKVKGIDSFDFGLYRSSQYNRMAEKIFGTYFS
ncbi:MAG: DGQHR domain-containing protein [Proteobacteria bacterium]|nr:DGQHR domain-containing protein [Pseudomonadota bacterium]